MLTFWIFVFCLYEVVQPAARAGGSTASNAPTLMYRAQFRRCGVALYFIVLTVSLLCYRDEGFLCGDFSEELARESSRDIDNSNEMRWGKAMTAIHYLVPRFWRVVL